MKRRDFIKATAAISAGAALTSCTGGSIFGNGHKVSRGQMQLRFAPYELQLQHTFTVSSYSRTTTTPDVLVEIEYDGLTGYGGWDTSKSSFLSRIDMLGNPDIIFVFGGTNDAWAHSPIGEYKYSDWTADDCKNFRPALACLLNRLQGKYPEAAIYAILNSELQEEVNESFREICKHCGVQLIELYDIEKQNGHPSIKGMQSICDQLLQAIK